MGKPARFNYGWVVVAAGALMTCIGMGAILSLAVFLIGWHLATTYQLDFYVRFQNIPTPARVVSEQPEYQHGTVGKSVVFSGQTELDFGNVADFGSMVGQLHIEPSRALRNLAMLAEPREPLAMLELSFGLDQQMRRPIFIGRATGAGFAAVKRYDSPNP